MAGNYDPHSETVGYRHSDVYLKANSIVQVVRDAFYFLFANGCQKPPDMTVTDYLINSKGLSKENLKRYLMKSHIRKMEADPTGETFDISLLYVCIQKACPNVADYENPIWKIPADTFEYAMYALKQHRNHLVHDDYSNLTDDVLMSLVKDIEKKLEILISKGKVKFKIQDAHADDAIRKTKENLNYILGSDFMSNLISKEAEKSRISYEMIVKSNGKSELKRRSHTLTFIDLSDGIFCIQGETKVPVNDIFTELEFQEVQRNNQISSKFGYENLLEAIAKGNNILIEGVAGCGKTTLVKKLLSDWMSGTDPVNNLSDFDLLLYTDGRSMSGNDFGSFLQSQLPEMARQMSKDDLMQSVLNSKTGIIIDGFDEMLHSSYYVLSEILHNADTQDGMQLLITTRSEKSDVLHRMLSYNLDVYHIKLTGISLDRRVEFIAKLGKAVIKSGQKGKGGKRKEQKEQDVTGLIIYFTATPWLLHHFGLPIYLYLLTMLWLQNRETLEYLKTPGSLYIAILSFMKNKLVDRLHSVTSLRQMAKGAITERINEFLEVVFWVSLVNLNNDTLSLSEESKELLIKTCYDLELPDSEMLHAFFSVQSTCTGKDTFFRINFPHKGIQEFYAAYAILNNLNQVDKKKVIRKVRKDIRKSLQNHHVPAVASTEIIMSLENILREKLNKNPTVEDILKDLHGSDSSLNLLKYQKVLINLIGLLKVKSQLKETLVRELISLIEQTKLSDPEQWLDIITVAECNRYVVYEVGKIIPRQHLCVRDGNLMAALLILQEKEDFKNIDFHLSSDPVKLPEVKKILSMLSNREIQLTVTFIHQWRYPELGSSDEFLEVSATNQSKDRGKLIHFTGSLTKLSHLGKRVEFLQLAIGSRYASNQDRDLDYMHDFTNIEILCIHIVGGLSLDCLPLLPRKFFPVDLWFSDTHDSSAEWTGKAIRTLLRSNKYRQIWSIRFPRSKLTVDGCLKLTKQLKGIIIGESGVWVSSVNLSQKDAETLEVAFLQELNVKFCISDEIKIWAF